jgi:hypothetical protein
MLAALVLLVGTATALAAVGSPADAADSSNTMKILAGEYTYKFSGAPQPGWVEIEFDNAGVEYHMVAVVKLKSGVTTKQLKAAALSESDAAFEKIADPKNADVSGMPELLAPGQVSTTISEMKAGHYGVLCFVPDAEGTPHIVHGMVKTFDVKGAKSSFKPPTDGVRDVTLTDTAITIPSDGITKNSTLKVTNEGTDVHSLAIVKLEAGKTVPDVDVYFSALFEGGPVEGPPPGVIVGGVSTMAPGSISYILLDLEPGHYGYASTQGDAPPDNDIGRGFYGEFDVS